MNAIARAIEAAGGPSKAAARLRCSAQSVCFYRDGKRKFPAELAAALEDEGGQAVRRWEMFPETWHQIWPELKDSEGAPPVPANASAVAPLAATYPEPEASHAG